MRNKYHGWYLFSLIFCTSSFSSIFITNTHAENIHVAVASNFTTTARHLATQFKHNTGHTVQLSSASTGTLYAQINNGAPFDVFLSANKEQPQYLEKQGFAVTNSRFTYAIGKLILWSQEKQLSHNDDFTNEAHALFKQPSFHYLSIANPALAPYGKAAQQTLESLGVWPSLQSHIVLGENINQAFQFVQSGNAEWGFIAYSQLQSLHGHKHIKENSYWLVPTALYQPIEQQAVLLHDTLSARDFLLFLKSPQALQTIHDAGYDTPHVN